MPKGGKRGFSRVLGLVAETEAQINKLQRVNLERERVQENLGRRDAEATSAVGRRDIALADPGNYVHRTFFRKAQFALGEVPALLVLDGAAPTAGSSGRFQWLVGGMVRKMGRSDSGKWANGGDPRQFDVGDDGKTELGEVVEQFMTLLPGWKAEEEEATLSKSSRAGVDGPSWGVEGSNLIVEVLTFKVATYRGPKAGAYDDAHDTLAMECVTCAHADLKAFASSPDEMASEIKPAAR